MISILMVTIVRFIIMLQLMKVTQMIYSFPLRGLAPVFALLSKLVNLHTTESG